MVGTGLASWCRAAIDALIFKMFLFIATAADAEHRTRCLSNKETKKKKNAAIIIMRTCPNRSAASTKVQYSSTTHSKLVYIGEMVVA